MYFSDKFFEKEVRDDFEVSEMMKRAWAAEMEVLKVVIDICNRNNLHYFADWGTLLGAVRHHGFIPWDDDIDICLRREDYDHLIKILPNELPYEMSVAGMYAKSERLQLAYDTSFTKVIVDERKINYMDYMKKFHGFPYTGIGIDIFPLDYISRDVEIADLQKTLFKMGMQLTANWDFLIKTGELEKCFNMFKDACNVELPMNKNSVYKLVDKLAALCKREEADYIANYTYWIEHDRYLMKKEWFEDTVILPFENMEIAVPIMYHEVLTAEFGDYMIPVKGGADHEYPFYRNAEDELKKQIKMVGFDGTIEEFCQAVSCGKFVTELSYDSQNKD